jgi:hypothetical protein
MAVALGIAALSPAAALVLWAGEALGAFIFVLVIALNAVALAAVAWGVQSSSGAALLGAVAGFRREARQTLRWLGAMVPTLIVIYAVVAPFVRV